MFSVQQRVYYSIKKGEYDPAIQSLLTFNKRRKRKEAALKDKQI